MPEPGPDLGLFPLDLVLMPGERIPLHIFEPRYRELIGECLDNLTEFGLIYRHGVALSPVGTRARVEGVLERFPDGRFNVVVTGTTRFRLVEETTGRSFITARVGELDEIGDRPSELEIAACLAAFAETQARAEVPELDGTPQGLAFAVAAAVGLPNEVKQELLEMLSERDRIVRLTDALTGSAGADIRAREIERLASGNGRVDHL
ncbi:MAG TPA: LON peptidase substrate-binding domain-containing protein [Actinomycetota bacterium]